MKLDLSKLFDNPGAEQAFDCSLVLEDVKRWGRRLFAGPVQDSESGAPQISRIF